MIKVIVDESVILDGTEAIKVTNITTGKTVLKPLTETTAAGGGTASNTRITALETSVDTETTGLLDRTTALEADIDTAETGILARLDDIEDHLKIPSGTPTMAVAATDTFTFGAAPTALNTIKIGEVTYTFVDALTTDPSTIANEILIDTSGSAIAETRNNLVAAIMGAAGEGTTYGAGTVANPLLGAVANSTDALDVTALIAGTVGNAYDKAATMTSELNVWTDLTAYFVNGVDGTVADAGEVLYDANYQWVAIGTCTTADSSNWKKISWDV